MKDTCWVELFIIRIVAYERRLDMQQAVARYCWWGGGLERAACMNGADWGPHLPCLLKQARAGSFRTSRGFLGFAMQSFNAWAEHCEIFSCNTSSNKKYKCRIRALGFHIPKWNGEPRDLRWTHNQMNQQCASKQIRIGDDLY